MTYKSNHYRYASQNRFTARYKQFFVLIGVIIIGMIISSAFNAIPSDKGKSAATKTEQHSQKLK